jgi:hypothetical protein
VTCPEEQYQKMLLHIFSVEATLVVVWIKFHTGCSVFRLEFHIRDIVWLWELLTAGKVSGSKLCPKTGDWEIVILDNDQLDTHLLYFTIYLLHSSTRFEHFMLIISRMNCIDAASGIVLSVSGRPVHRTSTDWEDDTRCCINTVHPPDDEHIKLETCRGI